MQRVGVSLMVLAWLSLCGCSRPSATECARFFKEVHKPVDAIPNCFRNNGLKGMVRAQKELKAHAKKVAAMSFENEALLKARDSYVEVLGIAADECSMYEYGVRRKDMTRRLKGPKYERRFSEDRHRIMKVCP